MKYLIIVLAFLIAFQTPYASGQPKERLKNRYREPNMLYGAPYTTFDLIGNKSKTELLNEKINEIRNLLTLGGPFRKYYSDNIYTPYWNTPNPTPVKPEDEEYDSLADFAKNKAFQHISIKQIAY